MGGQKVSIKSNNNSVSFQVIQKAPFGICIVNSKGFIEYVNPAMIKITSAPKEWILKTNVFKKSAFKEIGLTKKIRKGLKGEHFTLGPVDYFSSYKKRKVSRIFTGIPLVEDGERKLVVILDDITDFKKTEEKLLHAYKVNLDIVNKAPFGIYTVNAKGFIDYVNPAMINISGRPFNKFIGLNVLKSKQYDKIGLAQKIRKGLKGEYFRIGPIEYTSTIGKKTTVRIFTGIPLIGSNERKLLLIVEDITEFKKAEENIHESEERLRSIIDSANDAIVMLDNNAKIKLWNNAAKNVFGYDAEDIIGKPPTVFMPDDYYKTFIKKFKKMLRSKRGSILGKPFESNFIKKDGTIFPAEFSISPVKLKGEDYAVLIMRDVTLHNEIQEIRADILKDKEFEKVRNRLLMMVTHELKQPITPILGFANLIKKKISDPKLLSYIKGITASAERMHESVKKIMNFMKLESGEFMFNFKKVNLSEILVKVLGFKEPLINLRNILVFTDFNNVFVMGDSAQLSEVFENLIDNAIKFSNQGGTIELKSWSEGGRAYVSVKDYGKGIKEEDIPSLFNKFYQTDDGSRIGGFGLGLAICDEVVKAHKGVISVITELGSGSEFIVSLKKN